MGSSWPENLPSKPRKAIEELIQGREFANQLRGLLVKSQLGDDGLPAAPANDLVLKILNSFRNSLSILNSAESDVDVSQINQQNTQASSPCWDAPKSESSGESCRSISTIKDRRGCYKRRRTSQTTTKDTPTLIDDGHAWRKYGQKLILNTKYPRHYFRCTHKYDQGCQAAKQVQRIQEEPPMYRTTYIGNHICRTFPKVPQLILDSSPRDSSTFLLSFDNTFTNKQNNPFLSSFESVKQEHKEEIPNDDMTHNQSSSSDYLVTPDLTEFESFYNMTGLSSPMQSENGDVISGVFVGSVDFADDDLLFEFERC